MSLFLKTNLYLLNVHFSANITTQLQRTKEETGPTTRTQTRKRRNTGYVLYLLKLIVKEGNISHACVHELLDIIYISVMT